MSKYLKLTVAALALAAASPAAAEKLGLGRVATDAEVAAWNKDIHPDGSGLPEGSGDVWTGEEVCAKEVSPGHLERVAGLLRRKPLLWDNYPVNDGDRMSRHLHLRAFTGRPSANRDYLIGHAINPALQPVLTAIPAITLAQSYKQGAAYQYGQALRQAAEEVLGSELADQLIADLLTLQDAGLNRLSEARIETLSQCYRRFDHPAAREVLRWLAGDYQVTDEMVQTQ